MALIGGMRANVGKQSVISVSDARIGGSVGAYVDWPCGFSFEPVGPGEHLHCQRLLQLQGFSKE